MKPLSIIASVVIFSASALAVAPAAFQVGPKNMVSPTYRAPVVQAPYELTKRDIKKMEKTVELRADHLRIAQFYRAEAYRFDALGAAYAKAAATYRSGFHGKNVTAPARFEFAAVGFRKEAKANHDRADAHEQMANEAAGL